MTETNAQPSPQQPEQNDSWVTAVGSFFWDLVKILIVALIIIVPFRMYVAEPFMVSGTSMTPTFQNGDYLIIDRLSYHVNKTGPQRGDVVVFHFPLDTTQYFIKRIIGLPGDTISFSNGHVVITNKAHPTGWVLPESYLPSQTETYSSNSPVTLGEGEYYVLGDNRMGSSDSRVWGILPANLIVGKVWLRVVPLSHFGTFKLPVY